MKNSIIYSIFFLFAFFTFCQNIAHSMEKKDHQRTENHSSDGRYTDNGDGTITDSRTGLMWAKKDSFAELEKFLNWNETQKYVGQLRTGGYGDWRLPTVNELESILEKSKNTYSGVSIFISNLYLDPVFAEGAAPEHWSSEKEGSCCARYVRFGKSKSVVGTVETSYSGLAGVRSVRHP